MENAMDTESIITLFSPNSKHHSCTLPIINNNGCTVCHGVYKWVVSVKEMQGNDVVFDSIAMLAYYSI